MKKILLLNSFLLLSSIALRTAAMGQAFASINLVLNREDILMAQGTILRDQDQIIRSVPPIYQRPVEIALIRRTFNTSEQIAQILTISGELRRAQNPPLNWMLLTSIGLDELSRNNQVATDQIFRIYCLLQKDALVERMLNLQYENRGRIAGEVMY